jgi:hypothetical protein
VGGRFLAPENFKISGKTMKQSLIALAALVLCIPPASARCGLLTWSHDDTCAGPFRPKSAQEIVAADIVWRRSQMRGPIDACLAAFAHQRETNRLERAIKQIDSGPAHCTTNVFGQTAQTNCY